MKQLIRAALGRLGYSIQGIRYCPRQLLDPQHVRSLTLDDVLSARMVRQGPALTFIQVGAYDGVTRDPLRGYIEAHAWSGVMIEPQPGPVARLRELYKDNERIVVLAAAVDRARGKRPLHIVDWPDAPAWVAGMASFEREHIVRNAHYAPALDPETMIKEISVDCIPFDDAIARLPRAQVDLLQIDAEGADGYLLSLFPFDRLRPAIIHWEIKNTSKADQEATLDLLSGHGYRFARSGGEDMLAVLD